MMLTRRGVGADGGGEGGGLDDAWGVQGRKVTSMSWRFSMDSAAWRMASCSMVVVMRWAGAVAAC